MESSLSPTGITRRSAAHIELIEPRRLLSGGAETATGLISTLESVSFEVEGNLNGSPGFGTIPPSPSIAAGPAHIVAAVNSAIQFFTKAGTKTYESNLFNFFQNQAYSEMYDVRVMYDVSAARWIITALDQTAAPSVFGNRSTIFLAVSDDADPNGAWAVHSIDSRLSISGQFHYADFGNVGMDTAGAIFFTADMFRFSDKGYGGTRLWIIDKTQLLAGTLSFTLHNPFAAAGIASNPAGLAPTRIYSRTPLAGTYLVCTGGFTDGGGNDQVGVIRVSSPLTTPIFTSSFMDMGGDVDQQATPLPGAPQQGSAITIRTDDRRVQHPAVWQDGELFFANTILPTSGADVGQNTVRWYRAATANVGIAPALIEAGNIGGEDVAAGAHTFFPALSADANGNMVIGFSLSSPTNFASAALATRIGGATGPATVFAAGQDYYVRTYVTPALQSQNNLWGNFSTVAWDQTSGTYWTMQQYAGPRGGEFQGEDGRWRTRAAHVGVGVPDAPGAPDLLASSDSGASQTDNVTNDITPTISGTAQPGVTVRVFADGVEIASTPADGGGAWSTTLSLPAGEYTTSITAVADSGGVISVDSPALVVQIDTVAPALSSAPAFEFETRQAVRFVFDEDVSASLAAGDFTVTNTGTLMTHNPSAIEYVGATNTARLVFSGASLLPDGDYTAAANAGAIQDVAGNALVPLAPLAFFVLSGDANRDRAVGIGDFSILAARFNQAGTFSQGDFNYTGQVEIGDFSILASKFNTSLPAAPARTVFVPGKILDTRLLVTREDRPAEAVLGSAVPL